MLKRKPTAASWHLLTVAVIAFAVLFLLLFSTAEATSPTGGTIGSRTSDIEKYRGGDANGYGLAAALSVTSSPASFVTTGVSSTGVNSLYLANTGAYDAYLSTNGTSVSTANCQILVPAGCAFTSRSKSPVVTVYYYTPAPTTTTTLYVAY